jgi:Uma2 family endonuclease
MATITADTTTGPDGDQRVVLRGVGWEGYRALLRARGERPRPRIVYLDGDLYLMSPAFAHEHLKKRLGHFVMEVVVGLGIPCVTAGETTFRRRRKRVGVEGDETFYLANAARIVGTGNLHLRRDPPPDLAVEVVNTLDADAAVEVWRRFGVPEVWVCEADALHVLALRPNGDYVETGTSVAFPFLKAAEVFEWVSRPQTGNETAWVTELRRWVSETLLPRARGEANAGGGA